MSDPTVRFTPGMSPRPVQSGEPMTTLVFDQELVGRLQALQRGGFSIRAEQVITEHLAKVGQHRAGGRTPHEIKEYIWQQMQWGDAGIPAAPDGDLHSLRRSVRANTEIIDPPGSIRPQPPGQVQHGQVQPGQVQQGPYQQYGQPQSPGQFQQPTGQFQQPGATPPGGVSSAPFPPAGPGRPGGSSDSEAPEGGAGARVVGEILAWVPRALLVLSVYQLVRLIPGFDRMPDVSRWEPFRMIGDGVLEALNLNPEWSDQAANLTIPVLGVVLAALLNYVTPLRRGRKLHTWPYVLVIGAWIAVFAVSGVVSFASGASEDVQQGIQKQVEETVEDAVEDQVGQMTDDASAAAKDALEEKGQGDGG